ncbi:unnamed protein product [Rotaria socialis]|nr:unnamed protein product [Rotaria socialis]CAF4325437.1 unnamed protein product [Rotaria socialis]CAF4724293.1 unnamed protein product [Rotaria socialis]CAF4750411.1 unnamed protein product [Rotaria socialis]
MLGIVEKDVDKAVESVQEYYNNIDSNIDNVIQQIEMMISNSTDDQIMKANIRDTIKPFAKQYSDKHKDLHGSISKIGKTIDKCFHADFGNVPIFELFDKPEKLKLIYMIICEDLYRQGRMSIAQQLIEETNLRDNELFNVEKTFLEEINMILENLREKNLVPALEWCQKKRNELDKAGSLLEFHLHKMRFVQLLQMGNFDEAKVYLSNLRQYSILNGRCEQAVNELMGAFIFAQRDLSKSPYKYLLEPHLWLQLSELFMQQAFQQVGLSQDSPLYVVMKIGFQALPALMSIVNAMQNTQVCHILSKDELPIEVDVGQEHRYHSVFACPILRQQTTDQNPPMKLVCGHVISKDALNKLSIQNKLKCPYCPLGIGLDSCVLPLRHGGLFLVQSTDFFYPLIDDPYVMGKIACANVLSDIYAMGAIEVDNMLMLLSTSNKMSEKERDTIMPLILEGFKDCAEEAGTSVQGGQTVVNPWLIVGGVATSICIPSEIIIPEHAVVGDVLVLTKPLGTQVAVNAYQWIENPDRWNRIKSVVTEDEVRKGYKRAMSCMARLNRTGGKLMHKYNAHACTDVTGFGLLGHAENLAKYQKNEVSFVIHNLPIIAKMATITKACNDMFSLLQGKSAETSGGLLVVLPHEQAAAFCKDIEAQEGYRAWIIGVVEKGDRTAKIVDKPRIIEVPEKDTEGELW